MQSALATVLAMSLLGQIETSRPEVRSLELKYRLTAQDRHKVMHFAAFSLSSPLAVGHWVVFSLWKTPRVTFAGEGLRPEPANPNDADRASCVEKGMRNDPWLRRLVAVRASIPVGPCN